MHIDDIRSWLISIDARKLDVEALVVAFGKALNQAGIPVWRISTAVPTKHPEVAVATLEWLGGDEVIVEMRPHAILESPAYLNSPIRRISAEPSRPLHVPLTVADSEIPYAACREYKKAGGTGYYGYGLPSMVDGTVISFTTKAEGGFSPAQRQALFSLQDALAIRFEVAGAYHATESLLRTYLGRNAARRVLDGAFRRGDGQLIRAVIWTCDLRGFTTRVDNNPLPDVLKDLDRYFRCVAETVVAHDGEILKFMGDAVLALWPIDETHSAEAACRKALNAARAAFAAAEHEADLAFGVALHVGDVMYGNIGASTRLDFTVIGGAVNEAARVEAMCKTLGAPLLLTDTFVSHLGAGAQALRALGTHTLRGVQREMTLYTEPALVTLDGGDTKTKPVRDP